MLQVIQDAVYLVKIPFLIMVLYTQLVAVGLAYAADVYKRQDLRRFVNRRLREAGQDILMGNVDLKPYKQGNRTACDYCPYHAVCGFDTKTAGYGYRKLLSLIHI